MNMLGYIILALLTLSFAGGLFLNRTIKQNVKSIQHLVPAVQNGSTILTTNGIDTQGFDSAMIVVTTGAIVGAGNMSVQLFESPDNSTWTAVSAAQTDADILPAGVLAASKSYRIGYLGGMRYIGVQLTLNSGTSIVVGANAILGDPTEAPVAAS